MMLSNATVTTITATKTAGALLHDDPWVPEPSEGVSWTHIDLSQPFESSKLFTQLKEEFGETIFDLESGFMRSGIEQESSGLGFLVAAFNGNHEEDYVHIGFIVTKLRVVTLAMGSLPMIHQIQRDWLAEPEDYGFDPASLTISLLAEIQSKFFPALDLIHDQISDLEDQIYKLECVDLTDPLVIKRKLLTMRKQLAPMRDNLNSLSRIGAPIFQAEHQAGLSSEFGHCLRLFENIDLGRELCGSLMTAQQSVIGNNLNQVMRTMTVISTVLMISTLIAGVYGMNFVHMPELAATWGYPLALAAMICSTILTLLIFKKKKWF